MDETKQRLNQILEQAKERLVNAKPPTLPAIFMEDSRLEDAFKVSEMDEKGYSESIPSVLYSTLSPIEEGEFLYITSKVAMIESRLYSRYLDEEAIIWDGGREELYFYKPNPEQPKLAFTSGQGVWFAKKLKAEYADQSLEDIYKELRFKIQLTLMMSNPVDIEQDFSETDL